MLSIRRKAGDFILNINPGYNEELLEACKTLSEYAEYTARVRKCTKEMAITKAVSECIEEGILAEFLSKNRAEAMKVSIYEYDQERHIRQEREASREEGLREGIKEGINRGRSELIRHALEKGAEPELLKQLFDVTEEELEIIQKKMTDSVMPVAEVID